MLDGLSLSRMVHISQNTWLLRETIPTTFGLSSLSPGSMSYSLHESVSDVSLQLELAAHRADSSECRPEAGHRAFRGPQGLKISLCSVATEVPDWSMAPASPFFPENVWKLQE